MSRPRLAGFAGVLRRVADRLDPPPAAPVGDQVAVSRAELRRIQKQGLQMIEDYTWLSRLQGPEDGLLWVPKEVLSSIVWLINVELEWREQDLAAVEKDPRGLLADERF